MVPGVQGVKPQWQDVGPGPQLGWQSARCLPLELSDDYSGGQDDDEADGEEVERNGTSHTEAKHSQREQEEHEAEIDKGKPSVLAGGVTKNLSKVVNISSLK